jgi:hypothetical protein
MTEHRGELIVESDGTFRLVDGATRRHLRADAADVASKEAIEGDAGWTWAVELRDGAVFEERELDGEEWAQLFSHRAGGRGEPPSIHNTWCRQCDDYKTNEVSHGVCC